MISGAELFGRLAYPPNTLGYCGPDEGTLLADLLEDGARPADELAHVATRFEGAWPYLQLIASGTGLQPLDRSVVEAYWFGDPMLEGIDLKLWADAADDRFSARAGPSTSHLTDAIVAGGLPTHSFHVFCVYPWVGLLRSGIVAQALHVLDRCRVRWGQIVAVDKGTLLVASRPLEWDGSALRLGSVRTESVTASPDPELAVAVGDVVAMHWDYACHVLTTAMGRRLEADQLRHLGIANQQAGRFAALLG